MTRCAGRRDRSWCDDGDRDGRRGTRSSKTKFAVCYGHICTRTRARTYMQSASRASSPHIPLHVQYIRILYNKRQWAINQAGMIYFVYHCIAIHSASNAFYCMGFFFVYVCMPALARAHVLSCPYTTDSDGFSIISLNFSSSFVRRRSYMMLLLGIMVACIRSKGGKNHRLPCAYVWI